MYADIMTMSFDRDLRAYDAAKHVALWDLFPFVYCCQYTDHLSAMQVDLLGVISGESKHQKARSSPI